MDLERLALREGALGLMPRIEGGGRIGLTALRALPYAGDAELGLGQLCEWSREAGQETLHALLEVIHAIVSKPIHRGERLDAAGRQRCQLVLRELGARAGMDGGSRSLALSAEVSMKGEGPH